MHGCVLKKYRKQIKAFFSELPGSYAVKAFVEGTLAATELCSLKDLHAYGC